MDIIKFSKIPSIISYYSVVGKSEKDGPLGDCFDEYCDDDKFGKKSWEMAESEMQKKALNGALKKVNLSDTGVDILLAGDLLNQCTGSSYGLVEFDIPYVGLYGACSTCALGIALASTLFSGGICNTCAAVTSSHYCSSERQFRFPLEYGGQRTPTSQWTVTGSGAFIVGEGGKIKIPEVVFGKSVDLGISDINNMGAAMAPAAKDTLVRYFSKSEHSPKDFDMIITGDLGYEGTEILKDLMKQEGYDISGKLTDCGLMIYDREGQDKHAGGSGCGCSASVIAGNIMRNLEAGVLKDVLFIGTGALMSPLTVYQGSTIPSVAHLVRFTSKEVL